MKGMTIYRTLFALSIALGFVLQAGAAGVPIDQQVAVFKKVLKFDATLAGMDPVPVLIVRGGDARTAKDASDTFKGAGFPNAIVDEASYASAPGAAKVVYFCPDAQGSASLVPPGVLSLCGAPESVEGNQVAVGVMLQDGAPKLLISLAAYTASGHAIDSQVLGLAKVIR